MDRNSQKFFICEHCKNIIGVIENSGVPVVCCGQPMKELVANTTDAAVEKHVPVVTVDGNTVTAFVGDVEHPMTEAHYISWIYLKTNQGGHRKALNPDEKPEVKFALVDGEKPLEVYAYCNLHGLWKAEVK